MRARARDEALGTRPSALVESGGGLHAYWPISDGHDTVAGRILLKRWHRLVAAVADKLGVAVDNVYDMARMLRLPGSLEVFEQGVRAILGQLVSVAMAARLTGKVVARYGEPLVEGEGFMLFPTAERLAAADPAELKTLGMPLKRAESLIHFAHAVLNGELAAAQPDDVEQALKALQQYPGIGRWTANYFALRGWQAKDIFLPDDYLIKQRFPGMTPAQIRRYAERWQPWRSYALLHIWYSETWSPE